MLTETTTGTYSSNNSPDFDIDVMHNADHQQQMDTTMILVTQCLNTDMRGSLCGPELATDGDIQLARESARAGIRISRQDSLSLGIAVQTAALDTESTIQSRTVNETEKRTQSSASSLSPSTVKPKMDFGAKICIRSDFIQFLEMNLPRWGQYGLWGRDKVRLTTSAQAHLKLQHAYSYVCSLDSRMKEDAIRSRMAIVLLYLEFERICQGTKSRQARIKTAVGRGYISCMIDNILESTHPEWRTSNNRAKANMRAHFHNQKRYGKRWWILVNGLGHGILLLCSSRLAGLVYGGYYPSLGRVVALLTRTIAEIPRLPLRACAKLPRPLIVQSRKRWMF